MSSLSVDVWNGYVAPQSANSSAAPAGAETDSGAFDEHLQNAYGSAEHSGETSAPAAQLDRSSPASSSGPAPAEQDEPADRASDAETADPTPTAQQDAAAVPDEPKTQEDHKDKDSPATEDQAIASIMLAAVPTVLVAQEIPVEASPEAAAGVKTTTEGVDLAKGVTDGVSDAPATETTPASGLPGQANVDTADTAASTAASAVVPAGATVAPGDAAPQSDGSKPAGPAESDQEPVPQDAAQDQAPSGIAAVATAAAAGQTRSAEASSHAPTESNPPTEKIDTVRATEAEPGPPAASRAVDGPAVTTAAQTTEATTEGRTGNGPVKTEASSGEVVVPDKPADPAGLETTTLADIFDDKTTDGQAPDQMSRAEPADQRRVADGPQQAGPAQKPETQPSDQADRVRFVERVARAFEAAADRDGPVRLRLHPPELGSLRIELTLRNGTMTARVEAETETARTVLLDNLPALRERLAEHNIRVERFDVDWLGQSAGGLSQRSAEQTPWQDRRGGQAPTTPNSRAAADQADRPRQAVRPGGRSNFDVII